MLNKKQVKQKPRCPATYGEHACERELGHGRGWNGEKHRAGGFSWNDSAVKPEPVKSSTTQN
jgi:hypothetical protein